MNTQQSHMYDLRKQNYVTEGAFRAAQLCKADHGALKLQRGKLDFVCKLLVAADILEEGESGGLRVREKQEESKPDVVQQLSDGNGNNSVYLEECLVRAVEDIARVEKASAAAIEAMAENLRMQVDEKCQQVHRECCDRLDESLEDSEGRIATNSTRICHLAAEVEGLSRKIKEREAAARPPGITRVFSMEIADLPHQQTTTAIASPPQTAVDSTPRERRQKPSAVTRREEDPNPHPGVLGESCFEDQNHPEGGVRATFLATSLKQATSPPARRHSTYVGTAAGRMVVWPMRPQEDRPASDDQATPRSWARTSSWPLLANEAAAAARRLQGVKGSEQVNINAEAGGESEGKPGSLGGGTPIVEFALHGGDRPDTTKSAPGVEAMAGGRRQNDIAQKSQQSEDPPENHQAVDNSTDTSERRQPPLSPQSLARMTANEAAEALLGVTTPRLGRRVNNPEEQNGPSSATAAVATDTGVPGARLTCIAGTPDLWCPRATWDDVGAAEFSESEGSSTTVAAAEARSQKSRD